MEGKKKVGEGERWMRGRMKEDRRGREGEVERGRGRRA